MDGSQNFYLYWKDYTLGFGKLDEKFWLGLNKIHQLTTSGDSSNLRVDLEDFDGNKKFAKYSVFTVADALTNYILTVGGYSRNAGDSLTYHNGRMFSTRDKDNNLLYDGQQCAQTCKGAWRYKSCHYSNLNGLYLVGNHTSYANGINWYHWKGYEYSLEYTEMKVRCNN